MIKTSKTNIFTLILLLTSSQALQCNRPSTWQMFITFILGDEQQPQNNPSQASNITIDNYVAQFRSDLNGHNGAIVIPLNEIEEMEFTLRAKLCNQNLEDTYAIKKIMYKVIINQVRDGSIADLNNLQKEAFHSKNFFIIPHDYQTIPNSNRENVKARLKTMPHLNAEAIAQHFGEPRKNATRDSLIKRGPKYTHYY